ncbi:MAG: hypothetical protein ACTSPY_11580 [Candidatus Helarchaeota archaeon]
MSSIIKDFFRGIIFLFGKELRYYSISFISITFILTITSFNLFIIEPQFTLSITILIGLSLAHSFLVLALLSFIHENIRSFLLESKWRALIAPLVAVFGTWFFLNIFYLFDNPLLILYVDILIIVSIYLWLGFQAVGINLFGKFTSEWMTDSISDHKWKIILNITFCIVIFILLLLSLPLIGELEPLIKSVYPWYPVFTIFYINLCIFSTIIVITIISLIRRTYSAGFFSSGFFVICYGYQFYLPLRILIYVQSYLHDLIPAISIFDLLIMFGALVYTLQSFGGYISRGNKNILGLFFIIFSVSWVYETWYISSLMMEAIHGGEAVELTRIILSGISDFLIYIFSSILSIILGIIFYVNYLKYHKEYISKSK